MLLTYDNKISKVQIDSNENILFDEIHRYVDCDSTNIADVKPEILKAYGKLCIVAADYGVGISEHNKAASFLSCEDMICGNVLLFREDYNANNELDFVSMNEEEQNILYRDIKTALNLQKYVGL